MEHENIGWMCPACRTIYNPSILDCLCQVDEEVPQQPVAGFPISATVAPSVPECGRPWQTKSYFEEPFNLPKPPKYPGRDDGMENV